MFRSFIYFLSCLVSFCWIYSNTRDILQPPYPVLPGPHFFENYSNALFHGGPDGYDVAQISVLKMLINSTIMALGITIGKIIISLCLLLLLFILDFQEEKLFFG